MSSHDRWRTRLGITGVLLAVSLTGSLSTTLSADAGTRGPNGSLFFTADDLNDGPKIYRARPDGTHPQELTTGIGQDFNAEPSPGGRYVLFDSTRLGGPDIYRMRSDDSHVKRLTFSQDIETNRAATWSPDGQQIVYTHTEDLFTPKIWLMDASGRNQHPVVGNPTGAAPTYSPDGRFLLFSTFYKSRGRNVRQINKMRLDGSHRVRLATDSTDDFTAMISPDGRRIVLVRLQGLYNQVFVMNADGSHQIGLTHDAADNISPTCSPDSQRILFTRYAGESKRLWVMNVDGRNAEQLSGTNSNVAEASWGARQSTCLGRPVTIQGTEGADVLRGTPGPDVISGRGGNDLVSGLGGDDVLCGGAGADTIKGGTGADAMWGGRGKDTLLARDDEPDTVINCGNGHDPSARVDKDLDPRPTNC